MLKKEDLQRTVQARQLLDTSDRRFVYAEEIESTLKRKFKFVAPDMKLVGFANDEIATISDCFIMYAIAYLGVIDLYGIKAFLGAMAKKYTSLALGDYENADGIELIRGRVRMMMANGLLFRTSYRVGDNGVSVYTASEDAVNLVRQKLNKKIAINSWIAAKTASELIGWGCASYVGSVMAKKSSTFVVFLERVLRTKMIGSVFLPCEIKFQVDGQLYYVAVISAYLYQDKRTTTPDEFMDVVAHKLNTVTNYINCRTQKATAMVVVAVADNADLNFITDCMINSGHFGDYFGNIYFSSEATVNSLPITNAFFQVVRDVQSDTGYMVVSKCPEFIEPL